MADQQVSKLGIASVTVKATLAALSRAVVSPFKGDNGAPKYYKDVMFAMMRAQLGSLTLAQDRYLNTNTTDVYLKFTKKHGFAPESITLPSGTQAHWMGNKHAKKVILYYHGGGYVLPASDGHLAMLHDIVKTLPDTAVLLLAYDLAPEARYPTQTRQGVEALRYLVETLHRDPSHITIGGDSAGGNLTASVLSHLSHPHEDIPTLTLPSKLHAAILISPWASFNAHTQSFKTNAEKDMFDARTLTRWSSAFLGSDSPFAGDFYSEPVLAPAWWWEKTVDVVDEVLIWGGENEVLIDGIQEFAKRFEKGFAGKGGKLTTIVSPKAAHVEMIVESLLGYPGDSGTGSREAVKGWLKAKL
ncbi:alpha/beta-hydrolase [Sporormia fimetaria CBS 119925]|uniref:Alpha/beta-hydrolase n=1 Tax=Sporormia fimetaria CBS 119925 TaxID=1340428 RepID=A0A6A6V0P4_9PLEO|nr:alpha/beta-hydrolase [Sporormia fimetaria CBS 119925]